MSKNNLFISVISGEILVDVDEVDGKGKMDPYVVLTLGTQKYQTKVAQDQGKLPKWNETFNFVYDQTNNDLNIEAWDKDPRQAPDFIGMSKITLRDIEESDNWEREILIAKKGVKQGVINMVFDFVGKKPKQVVQDQKQNIAPKSQTPKVEQSVRKVIQLPKPMDAPKIQFKSCDYDGQIEDLDQRIQIMQQDNNNIQGFMKILNKNVQQAIFDGLDYLQKNKPENQVEAFGEFLINYQKNLHH